MQSSAVQLTRDPGQRARRSARIREARLEDYDQIAALHRRNGLSIRPFNQWMELWTGNPAYSPEETPLGWVLETERGEIAGSIGNLPLAYEFRGRRLKAATAYGWVVDDAFRTYSVMILSRFLRQPGVDLYVFTTVNEKAEPIYAGGFQCARVPVGAWNRSGFWITDYPGFSRSMLHRHGSAGNRARSGALNVPFALGLCVWDKVRARPIPRARLPYDLEFCSSFDARFDEFWGSLRATDDRLLALRDRASLEWHFRHSHLTIVTASEKGRMVGYGVFRRQDNQELSLRRERFTDFQALPGHGDAVGPVLSCMLQKCRAGDVHVREVMGEWLQRAGLPRIQPPFQRTLSSWTFYYKAADAQLAELLASPSAWAPSSYDGDASL